MAMDENAADGSPPREAEVAPRRRAQGRVERTFVVGYIASILVATIALILPDYWRSHFHEPGASIQIIGGVTWGMMLLALVPFVALRAVLGAKVMASPAGAGFVGVLTAMSTLLLLCLAVGGIKGIVFSILFVGVTVPIGAAAGIAYWLVEFSPVPTWLGAGVTDRRPMPWTGGLLSRRISY